MSKKIYRVTYNWSLDGNYIERVLGRPDPDEVTGEDKTPNSFSEEWTFGERTVTIYYDDGSENTVFNVSEVSRR